MVCSEIGGCSDCKTEKHINLYRSDAMHKFRLKHLSRPIAILSYDSPGAFVVRTTPLALKF